MSQCSQSEGIILTVKKRFRVNFLKYFLLFYIDSVCKQEWMNRTSRNQPKLALFLPDYTLNQPGPHCDLQSRCTLFDHTQSHKYRPAARWCASVLSSPLHRCVNQRVLSNKLWRREQNALIRSGFWFLRDCCQKRAKSDFSLVHI